MNEVSALSPFPARYTSINFTTSQSGEHRTEDEKGEMKEKRCSDADVCVDSVSLCVCLGFFLFFCSQSPSLFLSFSSFSLCSIFSAPALLTGGCSRLRYPVRSHYSHCGGRKGQMRDGRTKRRTEQEMKVDEWGEERRMGHCADKVHRYTVFQETHH